MEKDLLSKAMINLSLYRPHCYQKSDITFICQLCKYRKECEVRGDDQ